MKYSTELLMFGKNTGIEIPEKVLEELGGGKRPRLKVTIKDFSFQVTPGSMQGKVLIPVSAERRKAAGVAGGDQLDVTIELDNAPVEIDVPADFAAALEAEGLRASFDKLAPSHRKEHVRAINEAKTEATRQKRIVKSVEIVRAKTR